MAFPSLDLAFLTIILQLIFLEGILSFDNAAVLGAMIMPLPADQPVPWPRPLRPLGRLLNPLVGPQRQAALKVGLLGAYLGRAVMLVLANAIIANPWLQFIGAVYLIKIAVEHLGAFHPAVGEPTTGEREAEKGEPLTPTLAQGRGFWATVVMVELMDLAFSLDNVVAAVALSSHLVVVMIGVGLGILAMRFAASLFTRLIAKEPALNTAAYLLVFNIGVEFLLAEFAHLEFGELTRFGINILTIVLVLIYAHAPILQRFLRRPLHWLARLCFYLDQGINRLWLPVQWVLTLPWRAARTLVRRRLAL